MQQHLQRALTFLHGGALFIGRGLKELGLVAWARPIWSGVVVVGLIVLGTIASYFLTPATVSEQTATHAVHTVRVGDISGASALTVIGSVRATNEALVAPDVPGTVSAIYRNLGDYVAAGSIIATLKNDSQRAAVAQAVAALDKTKSSVTVGGIGVENAQNSYTTALSSARSAITTAYSTIDDAVHRKADETFSNPNGTNPHFSLSTSNSQLVSTVDGERLSIQSILARHATIDTATMDADALLVEMNTLSSEVATTQDFLQDLVLTLNNAIATYNVTDAAIASYRADASAALANVNALATSVSGNIENLKAKRAAITAAQTSLANGPSGESADIASAQAGVAAAQAQLEKTYLRAPISGTINRLDLDVGSFVNAASPVIYITNTGGLEAVAYVSVEDLRDVAVNAKADISGVVTGTVVRVAAAVDPITKKAEVRISVPPNAPLVAGQSATISITRSVRKASAGPLTIPLAALKITPTGPVIFSVDEQQTLVAHAVVLGTLHGDKVDITSGIAADSVIVTDARGLKEGQVVIVE